MNRFHRPHGSFLIELFIGLTILSLSSPSHAGAQRPCNTPRIFRPAALNVVVLPYRFDSDIEAPPRSVKQAGRKISALVQQEILFSLLKYKSVGVTNLVAPPGEVCDVDKVVVALRRDMEEYQSLIVVWGRIFPQGGQYQVQTYARFIEQGNPHASIFGENSIEHTRIRVALDGITLRGKLPTRALSFPPRQISENDLVSVSTAFQRSMVLRAKPELDHPGVSLDISPSDTFSYYVTRVQGNWMFIAPSEEGSIGLEGRLNTSGGGWVHISESASQEWSLRRWLPELAYIDALSGYLRAYSFDVYGDMEQSQVSIDVISQAVDSGFRSFESAVNVDDAPIAYGLARAIRGFLIWRQDSSISGRSAAATLFDDLPELMPDYSDAHNLAATTLPLRGCGSLAKCAPDIERGLTSALALDPQNRLVSENLLALYGALLQTPESPAFSADELRRKIDLVDGLHSSFEPSRD